MPTAIELFCGTGGMALGLEQAGFELKLLLDLDKDSCKTISYNRPNWNIMNENIQDVSFKNTSVDLVSGGFPCQPFSHAGHKLGFKDVRGTVFYEFARAIKEIQPRMFIAENVEAILRNDNGNTIRNIMSIFHELGYDVKYDTLNALDFRVPQKRKRVFFIGTKHPNNFEFPKHHKKIFVLRDALKNVKPGPGMKYSTEKASMLKHVPPGGCWVNMPTKMQKKYMGKSFYSTGGRRGMGRRISWDEPCLTLTCSPGQKMTDRCHPDEERPFTIREYARIQTFPDYWKFIGSMSSQYRQIGNAVPVKLSKAIGKSLLNFLSSKESFLKQII